MKYLKGLLLFFLALSAYFHAHTQVSIRDSAVALSMISISYGGYLPGGDLADRFGYTNSLGLEAGYKFKNNWYGTVGGSFLFGNRLNEPVAQNILVLTSDFNGRNLWSAIGSDGRFSEVRLFERGIAIPLKVGKIFPLFDNANPNSGLYVEAGAQFIQHKVKIEVIAQNVPSLDPEQRKGYDRLTNGFGLVQSIGYRHFGNSYLANIYVGLDFSQNFTELRRDAQYDTGVNTGELRFDLLSGFRVGWVFPIYQKAPDKFYIF